MDEKEFQLMFEYEDTHPWYVALRSLVQFVLDKVLGCKKDSLIMLDVGCGTGRVLDSLGQKGNAVGVDISSLAIKYCRRRGLHKTLVASALALPFPADLFDVVICLDVLSHRNVTDKSLFLMEICRVLNAGGIVVLNVPTLSWLYSSHDVRVQTDKRFSCKEIVELLNATGFRIVYLTHWNTFLLPWIILIRIGRKFIPGKENDLVFSARWGLNSIFHLILTMEKWLLRFFSFPIGLSILLAATKES